MLRVLLWLFVPAHESEGAFELVAGHFIAKLGFQRHAVVFAVVAVHLLNLSRGCLFEGVVDSIFVGADAF